MNRVVLGLIILGIGFAAGQVVVSAVFDGNWQRAAMITSAQWIALATAWFVTE